MMERVVAIVQARQGSSRLPGKSLRPLSGKPLILHVLERARAIPGVVDVVLATSTHERDDLLAVTAVAAGFGTVRGSELDVLDRMLLAARVSKADHVMRVTGDCPLLAPDVAREVLQAYLTSPFPGHYVSNDTSRTGWPDGTDTEIFSMGMLESAARLASKPGEREHVTRWIRAATTCGALKCDRGDFSKLKLSVDDENDFQRVQQVYAHLKDGDMNFDATIAAAREAGLL